MGKTLQNSEKLVSVSCRISWHMQKKLLKLAQIARRTPSSYLRTLLEDWLNEHDEHQRKNGTQTRRQAKHDEAAGRPQAPKRTDIRRLSDV